MFVDDVVIRVAGGRGGDGLASFLKQKYKPKGGPDGGDGGDGGNVYITLDKNLQSLQKYRNKQLIGARDGRPGMKFKRQGKSGAHVEIGVPAGTIVTDVEAEDELGEIAGDCGRLLVARGGRGGRGNRHFATSRNQAPRRADEGEPGEERTLRLAYFIQADVALAGLANSGKSALAAALAGTDFEPPAHPFSTRNPTPLPCGLAPWLRIVILDLPSVRTPDDASAESANRFLRQLRRPRAILYTIDAASAVAPEEQFRLIKKAVSEYVESPDEKTEIVVVTRTDLAEAGHAVPLAGASVASVKDEKSIENLRNLLVEVLEN